MKKRFIIMGAILFFVISYIFIIGICVSLGLRGLFDGLRFDCTIYTCGDFDYIVIEDDGEQKAAIKRLSEEGKNKQVIVVPEYLDEYKVYGLYDQSWSSKHGRIHNRELKLYINFKFKIAHHNLVTVNKVFTMDPSYIFEDEVGTTEFRPFIPSTIDISSLNVYEYGYINNANVSYYSNYGDNSIYWIDDYENEELISYVPEDPKREGYVFNGWYKEPECINRWNFKADKVPGKNYYKDRNDGYYRMDNYDYIETKLYAKWIEE